MESTVSTYRLADIGTRFIALIIDNILVSIVGGFFGANGEWFMAGVIGFLVGAAYQWFFLTRNNGQTPGKMFLNVRVVKTDGTAISDLDAILRAVGSVISGTFFALGYLWAFFDPQRQTLHDKLSRTYVVIADREKVHTVDVGKRKTEEVI